jgi:hypothetical protein
MLDVMDDNVERTMSFSYLGNKDTKAFLEKLQKAGYINSVEFGENMFFLDGDNLREVYDNLLKLQDFAKNNDAPDHILNKINKVATDMKDTIDKYGEMYDQYVLYEEILPDETNSDYYSQLTDAYKEYQEAFSSGDEDAIKKAEENYAKVIDTILDSNASTRVKEFFKALYPDLQEEVSTWRFKVDFYTDDGEESKFGKKVNKHLNTLGADDTGDILNFNYESASKEEKKAYDALVDIAEERGMSIEELVQVLQDMGILQDEKYQQLIDTFGKDNVETLTDDDLQYAYKIENIGELTFEEFVEEIQKAKKEANKVELNIEKYKAASDSIASLATAYKELTDSEYVSLETISKIKEAVGSSISNWDEYEQKLLSVKKGTEEYNQLMRELTYATLESQLGGVNALAQADEKYVAQLLKENGVLNANEVAHSAVERAKAKEWVQSQANNDISENTINSLISQANAAGVSTTAYLELTAKEILFNNNNISTKNKCEQILAIAKTAGVATTTLDVLNSKIEEVAGQKIGSGARTKSAKEAGLTVIKEKNRKDGKKNGNLYVHDDGSQFDDYKEAMYYAEAYNTTQRISNAFSNVNFELPDYSGAGGSGSEDTKETFDWIETKLKRIQRIITNLGKTVSATYKTWGKRNSELVKQISKVNEELAIQQQGRSYYESKANSVGLDPAYQELVKYGGIRIDEISDETLKEQIQEYQEWYEKALACEDAIQDLNDELANLARQKFDNISKQFENEMSGIEHEISMLEGYVDKAETKGYLVSKKYYSEMKALEEKNIITLQNEYDMLNDALKQALDNNQIELYSEEWYNMCGEINAVQKEILDANTSLIELQNTMNELEWEVFDKTQEFISEIKNESDFLIDLMSDEKMYDEDTGSITEHGQATLGLHALNYNTYMSQADDYAEELNKINAEIAEDPNNLKLLERRQELLEAQRDMISAAEDEKQAMKDLVSDGYDAFLNAMQEIIDKRKEAMNQIKD